MLVPPGGMLQAGAVRRCPWRPPWAAARLQAGPQCQWLPRHECGRGVAGHAFWLARCFFGLAHDMLPPALVAATLLGATLGDRLRINAKWALRGMYAQHDGGAGGMPPAAAQLQFVGGLQSRLARWRLSLQVGLLRLAFWLSSLVHGTTSWLVPMAQ